MTDIGVGVFFILASLLCGIAYGYFLGKEDARKAKPEPAPYAANDLREEGDPYLLGFCDGVQAQKAIQKQKPV